jgi:hypothetical protein
LGSRGNASDGDIECDVNQNHRWNGIQREKMMACPFPTCNLTRRRLLADLLQNTTIS